MDFLSIFTVFIQETAAQAQLLCSLKFVSSFSYNRLGSDAEESDVEQIIEMAGKASVADQQNQVQENVHSQIKSFCSFMDEILLRDVNMKNGAPLPASGPAQQRSGLSLAVGKSGSPTRHPGKFLVQPLYPVFEG